MKKGSRSGETHCCLNQWRLNGKATDCRFWVGGLNHGRPMLLAFRIGRPKRSRFGCIAIQPLLAVTGIFHGALVKEEGQPPLLRSNVCLGKGPKAANGDRPVGAASCRQEQYTAPPFLPALSVCLFFKFQSNFLIRSHPSCKSLALVQPTVGVGAILVPNLIRVQM